MNNPVQVGDGFEVRDPPKPLSEQEADARMQALVKKYARRMTGSRFVDASHVYAPYIPLMTSDAVKP